MRSLFRNLFFLSFSLSLILLWSCGDDDGANVEEDSLAITAFTPVSAMVGAEITITGTGFSTDLAENVVTFNGVSTDVKSATATQLKVDVPNGATTGKISVEVGDDKVSSSDDFIVEETPEEAPSIDSFSPESGEIGDEVVITGSNFSETASENIVEFNGIAATVSAASTTELTVIVPSGTTTGKIKVTVDGAIGISTDDFIVLTNPVITGFSKDLGFTLTKLTLIGENFGNDVEDVTVRFGSSSGKSASINSVTNSEIEINIPTNLSTGDYAIYVEVDGRSFLTEDTFEVRKAHSFSSFNPSEIAIGEDLTINGLNFYDDLTYEVSFLRAGEQVYGTVKSVSSNQLVVTVPSAAVEGFNQVRIEVRDYTSTTSGVTLFKPWVRAGTNGDDIAPGETDGRFDVAVGEDGSVYVAYQESNNDDRLAVRKYDGTSWELVGANGISSTGIGRAPSITVYNNEPYVVYNSFDNANPSENGLKVEKFNGTNWARVGGLVTTNLNASGELVFDEFGNAFVGIQESNNFLVKKLSNDLWVDVTTNPVITNFSALYFFGFNPSGDLIAVGNRILTLASGSSTWDEVNPPGTTIFSRGGRVAMDAQGNLKAVAIDINFNAFLYNWTGSTWEKEVDEEVYFDALTVEIAFNGNQPYIAYTRRGGAEVSVYTLIGGAWSPVGKTSFESNVSQPILRFADGNPYIVFLDFPALKAFTIEGFNLGE